MTNDMKQIKVSLFYAMYVYPSRIIIDPPFGIFLKTYFKGRLQSKYKFVWKVAFLYTYIPAKYNFSEKFMF